MAAEDGLKVLIVSSEISPYAKSGGLGDVAGSLPRELLKRGVDVRAVTPKYKSIDPKYLEGAERKGGFEVALGWRRQNATVIEAKSEVPTYFIENGFYFDRDGYYGYGDDCERFAFFSKAAVELPWLIDFKPDVIHCNDWQTGLVPLYLKDFYSRFLFFQGIKTLYTIHNLQYQGVFSLDALSSAGLDRGYGNMDKLEFNGGWSFMKAGVTYSDLINAVSVTYAREIQNPTNGFGMDGLLRSRADGLFGVINGIDEDEYDPSTDKRIFHNYDINGIAGKELNKRKLQERLGLPVGDRVPLFSIVSRLVDQKGLDLVAGVMDELASLDAQLVILGTGDGKYERLFRYLGDRYPGKLSVNITFDEALARQIYAGSDIFLMPSLFEPCGLGQLIAMRYGAIPVARETGGLADTIVHGKTGFLFKDYLLSGLMWAVRSALELYADERAWENMARRAMNADHSWKRSADEYIKLYEKLKENPENSGK